jgi:hypothetical protein
MTNEVYQPSISVWKLIQANVPEFEQDEMKSLLGESLIEQSLDLHEEVLYVLYLLGFRNYKIYVTEFFCHQTYLLLDVV